MKIPSTDDLHTVCLYKMLLATDILSVNSGGLTSPCEIHSMITWYKLAEIVISITYFFYFCQLPEFPGECWYLPPCFRSMKTKNEPLVLIKSQVLIGYI